jgi:hypothetical protein
MRRAPVLAAVLMLATQLAFDIGLVHGTWPPSVVDGRDMLAFVTAGRILADPAGQPADVYEPEVQRRVQEEITGRTIPPGTGLPFIHPPHLLPVQEAFAYLSDTAWWWRWTLLMTAMFLAGFALLDGSLARYDVGAMTRLEYGLVGLVFFPVVVSLVQAQDTGVLYLGVAAWIAALSRRKDFIAGLALSLATIRPQIAVALALPFLFARRRVAAGFLAGCVLVLVWSLLAVGIEGLRAYLTLLIGVAGATEFEVDPEPMISLVGQLRRILPASSQALARILSWSVWIGMIAGVCRLWLIRGRSGGPGPGEAALAVYLSLVLSPHLNYHDLALLHAAGAPALAVAFAKSGTSGASSTLRALLFVSLAVSASTITRAPLADLLRWSGLLVFLIPVLAASGVGRKPRLRRESAGTGVT